MYYEEKLIGGILMCRTSPSGDWRQCSIEKMSKDIIDYKKTITKLRATLIVISDMADNDKNETAVDLDTAITLAENALSR
jgi:hypothetical protein